MAIQLSNIFKVGGTMGIQLSNIFKVGGTMSIQLSNIFKVGGTMAIKLVNTFRVDISNQRLKVNEPKMMQKGEGNCRELLINNT